MTPPSDRERILCAMFESFCVAAIRNFGRNLRRAMRNHQKYDGTGEVSVEYLIGLLSSEDVYASEQFVLDVDGLPRRKRFALRFSLIAGICNFDRFA